MVGLIISLNFLIGEHSTLEMMEICDNALDDDGDGQIDLNDSDCECSEVEPLSLIPNPSFEDQTCCPSGRSELNCAADWIQASDPTTDYIHTCGWLGWNNIPAPMPFPDGDAVVGFRDGRNIQGTPEPNWKEYAGACLLAPLKKGVEYTFEFHVGFVDYSISPAINITFFGTSDCDNLPFGAGNSNFGCPTNGENWEQLGAKNVSGNGWVKTSITVKPKQDINAIAIGPSCALITSNVNLYYFFDNLVLAESIFFPKIINEIGDACAEEFELSVEEEEGTTYQWYKNGIAIVGETESIFRPLLTDGDYAVIQYLDGQCNLSRVNKYRVHEEVTSLYEIICDDEMLVFGGEKLGESGIYVDTIQTRDGCDSILLLDLNVLGKTQDSIYAKIFPGDEYMLENFSFADQGGHDVVLQSKEGCDSLIYLDLDLYKVFIPNIFSPNKDGVNDFWEVFIEDRELILNSIKIFNRWGGEVFVNNWGFEETSTFWDGSGKNGEVGSGVYTYMLEFRIGEDDFKIVAGDVTVVR